MKIDFKNITDEMAEILIKKNKAYGNSFDEEWEELGSTASLVHLRDKYNRIKYLIQNDKLTENGESILDSLFDNAGYSILAIRYLVNKGYIDKSDIDKYFKTDINADVNSEE